MSRFDGIPEFRDEIDCFDPQSRDKEIIKGTVIAAILNKEKRGENVVAKNRYAIVLLENDCLALCYSLPPVKRGNCPDQWVVVVSHPLDGALSGRDFYVAASPIILKILEFEIVFARVERLISEKNRKAA